LAGSTGNNRILRGGFWNNYANTCRVAYRYSNSPAFGNYANGFRPVRR